MLWHTYVKCNMIDDMGESSPNSYLRCWPDKGLSGPTTTTSVYNTYACQIHNKCLPKKKKATALNSRPYIKIMLKTILNTVYLTCRLDRIRRNITYS